MHVVGGGVGLGGLGVGGAGGADPILAFSKRPQYWHAMLTPQTPWKLMGETSGGNQYLAATGNWCSRSDKHNKAKHCAVAVNSILIGQQRSLRLAQPFTWDFSPSPSSFFSASETPPPTGPWTDMKR